MTTLQVCCLVISLLTGQPPESWPQWGGPHRNFNVDSNGLADSWPESGLRRLWIRPLGDGYSGVAVVNGRLYTMYRKDDHESVVALEPATGQTLWEHSYPAPFLPNTDLEPGPGPHTTPLVVDDRVVAVGVTGILHCLDSSSGRVVWSHNLLQEFDGTVLFRGYSSSPIAYDDSVIVPVGGPGHAMVAFRMNDGSIKWQSQDFHTSHASPLLIKFHGGDQLVVFADKVIAALDPRDGELIWQHSQPFDGGHIASMPVWSHSCPSLGEDGQECQSYTGGIRNHADLDLRVAMLIIHAHTDR